MNRVGKWTTSEMAEFVSHVMHHDFIHMHRFHTGPESLGAAMRRTMSSDPVTPILTEAHLTALDRRVTTILQVMRECLTKARDPYHVIINDLH